MTSRGLVVRQHWFLIGAVLTLGLIGHWLYFGSRADQSKGSPAKILQANNTSEVITLEYEVAETDPAGEVLTFRHTVHFSKSHYMIENELVGSTIHDFARKEVIKIDNREKSYFIVSRTTSDRLVKEMASAMRVPISRPVYQALDKESLVAGLTGRVLSYTRGEAKGDVTVDNKSTLSSEISAIVALQNDHPALKDFPELRELSGLPLSKTQANPNGNKVASRLLRVSRNTPLSRISRPDPTFVHKESPFGY